MIDTIDEEAESQDIFSVSTNQDEGTVWTECENLNERKSEGKIWLEGHSDGTVDKDILQIYRNKQLILMEANLEKEKRLEELEKEFNDHNVQHKEGIYWLRLQLDTTRQEKKDAEERLSELRTELQKLSAGQPLLSSVDNETDDDVRSEKDVLISRLQHKIKRYEISFGVMENQMAMIETSSGSIINTLKKEIADLMEDRTKVELDLLNQLSDLDNENRKRQLEFALELENKNEKIEALRKGQQVSLCTVDNSSRFSSEDNNSEAMGYFFGTSSKSKTDSQSDELIIHRLGGSKSELHRIIEASSTDSEEVRMGPNSEDDTITRGRIWEERHRIESSICRVKTILESTNTAISNLEDIVTSFNPGDESDVEIEKEKILSIHQSASLIHDQIKVSIALIELKLRNEFDRSKSDCSASNTEHSTSRGAAMNSMEAIKNDTLLELEKVEAECSRQLKELEERLNAGAMSQNLQLDSDSSSHQADHILENSKAYTNDTLVISRGVLHLLENELIQFANCMQAKNETIDSLKAELRRQKEHGISMRRDLKAASKGESYSAARERSTGTEREYHRVNSREFKYGSKTVKVKKKHSLDEVKMRKAESKNASRRQIRSQSPTKATIDTHSKKEVLHFASIKLPSNMLFSNEKKSPKIRHGMPDASLRGGTDALSPCKPIFPRHRDKSEMSSSYRLPNANDIVTNTRSVLLSEDSN
mmetsp:Transcript_16838/g.38602  ORF Transcript_16838/g.38602 Transcript_16838/m.38602 type:complete len:707 (-) Transcript_16838:160-2280(-)|eukprot:CAMPEP_0172399234 /NCGR_PEP_ID=MMETSP1061-20121228/39985_1 /TAXON_ID=37318 /ORGANISM="Pseudo-nitzschia pungens, Strain cf. pungens" /LENGTH=706 /DNA_ID=CAMNT_0013132045 /DNA_START=126 /DNA_END=2246 /DNA_ORIENTATION=+